MPKTTLEKAVYALVLLLCLAALALLAAVPQFSLQSQLVYQGF